MPKIYGFIFAALIFAGCTQLQYVSFNVKTPGVENGVFIIRNDTGGMAYSANIRNHHLILDKQIIQQNGYYTLNVSNSNKKMPETTFDIYLEPGQYDIELSAADAAAYPKIKSPSAIQHELSDFYNLSVNVKSERKRNYRAISARLNSKETNLLAKEVLNQLLKDENDARKQLDDTEKDALKAFVQKHPKSVTGAHIMAGMPYEGDPVFYYNIFKQLPAETQKSYDGQIVGDKLSALVKLVPGHEAPAISGTTPDGKPFDKAMLKGKKIYLVELWKSASQQSREQHSSVSLGNMIDIISDKSQLGMISISLDHKRDWWTSAIADDKMDWPQYSDLKGNESVNVTNWGVTHLPTYYLVDANWRIAYKDLSWSEIPVAVNQYLLHH